MPNLRSKTWTTTTPANVGDAQYWEDHLISDSDAAKILTAVQTVNGTSPDAGGNVDVVALPSGGTTGQILTKQSSADGDADWDDPASSGHTIEDEDGVTMPYQSTLQFLNAEVTDDSLNSKTVVDCKGSKGDPGAAATIAVGSVSTLPAGSSVSVVNSGTSSAAVFDFGIPRGADGTNGTNGISVTGVSLQSTAGLVKTYRMTFSDGSYFDFNVTDGTNGTGAGDMLANDYDPTSTVFNAGGIPAYVASQAYSLPTADSSTLGGVKVGTNLSIDGSGVLSATDTTYSDATTITAGLMSASDKTKLDGIASGAEVNVQADWNESNSASDAYIANKPSIPDAQIQADWNQSNSGRLDYIKNKPSIPTISTEHSGTASTTNVRKQTITINSIAHDVDGSVYMEETANSASFSFSNAAILTTSAIDVYTDTWGDNPSEVKVPTNGTCNVTFSEAKSRTVRIYIK